MKAEEIAEKDCSMNHKNKVLSAMEEANKKLKKMHVCRVGVMGDEIVTYEEMLVTAEGIERFQKAIFTKELYKTKVHHTIKQILDNRRGYVQRFNYCPDCGLKIDWKSLTEGL